VKREVREYTRGMGYALPRPIRRWLEGQIAGLREPLKLAIIRLARGWPSSERGQPGGLATSITAGLHAAKRHFFLVVAPDGNF
jgi:hypothetical protein